MRKLCITGIAAVVMASSVVGIAYAVNTYEVTPASGSPNKVGSLAKPIPALLNFGYIVSDSEGLRPSVIDQYYIAAEGVKFFPRARPTCTFSQATQAPSFASACKRALVGKGTISNWSGAPNDRTQKLACDVKMTLLNISNGPSVTKKRGGMGIRVDADPPGCPIPVHGALAAPFFNVIIEGVPTSELRFKVPNDLRHPGGLDNAVVKVVSHVFKKTGKVKIKGKTRTVGFASGVGRKGKKRTVRVTFVSEDGHKATATTTFPK